MNNANVRPPQPVNEPINSYAPGTPERASLKNFISCLKSNDLEIPAFIGGKEVYSGNTTKIHPPHELSYTLGTLHHCSEANVHSAIDAALAAREEWSRMDFVERAAIFLKAADLLAGKWRNALNASTMLGQSKNAFQAEIDSACEIIDFFRFNVEYAHQIYSDQPYSGPGTWNRLEYRPLEGFVFAVTPFNFTSITANLPTAPALMGNTVVWKPATSSIYSAYYIYRLLEEAGLPPGVINMVPGRGATIGGPVFASPHFAGLHFTGSTRTFQYMWQTIGSTVSQYHSYPRVVGETGGKDFIVAHASADADAVATSIVRGSFEYQGQKCSAASRVYLPASQWPAIKENMLGQLSEIRMGTVEDFGNFVNAVIDRKAFDSITGYIDHAKASSSASIIHGGNYSDEEGYFIEPTVILTTDPTYRSMCEEILDRWSRSMFMRIVHSQTLFRFVNNTSPYALTGAIFAKDRQIVVQALDALRNSAGNFYINDKPTGAVVGQQPFGGARASGTNDKAGSPLNLLRWVSARTIKETFSPTYPLQLPFPGF